MLMKDRETSSQQVEHEQSSSWQIMTATRHWPQTEATKTVKKDNIQFGTQLQSLYLELASWEIQSFWDFSPTSYLKILNKDSFKQNFPYAYMIYIHTLCHLKPH